MGVRILLEQLRRQRNPRRVEGSVEMTRLQFGLLTKGLLTSRLVPRFPSGANPTFHSPGDENTRRVWASTCETLPLRAAAWTARQQEKMRDRCPLRSRSGHGMGKQKGKRDVSLTLPIA